MQSKQTEALKQALTELFWYEEAGLGRISSCDAIHALQEALADQPAQQEPCDMGSLCIGCSPRNADGSCPGEKPNGACDCYVKGFNDGMKELELPPQRKPLTDKEIGKAWSVADGEHNASASVKRRITRAIEAKLKEKNT